MTNAHLILCVLLNIIEENIPSLGLKLINCYSELKSFIRLGEKNDI